MLQRSLLKNKFLSFFIFLRLSKNIKLSITYNTCYEGEYKKENRKEKDQS